LRFSALQLVATKAEERPLIEHNARQIANARRSASVILSPRSAANDLSHADRSHKQYSRLHRSFSIDVSDFHWRLCAAPALRLTWRNQEMEIKRSGSQPSSSGPAEYFTGSVRIDRLFEAPEPARVRGASVTFEPRARTAWHTHPLGQTLIVTSGLGWAQRWGGPIEEIRPGDVIWFPPGEKHWHGATPTTAMTHIAIQEALDGKPVDWMEHVTDEQYKRIADSG
jgi:quercetin dioxygenase-like cupin family protein